MTQENCVHTEHCCLKHGCKYREEDCPVALGLKKQSFLCEDCIYDQHELDEKSSSIFFMEKDISTVNNIHKIYFINNKKDEYLQVIVNKNYKYKQFYIKGDFHKLKLCNSDLDREHWFELEVNKFMEAQ